MPSTYRAMAPPALAAASRPATLLRHGAITAAVCLLITLVLTLMEQGRWDVNLVYSLAIGLPSWLTIDLGRMWLSRGSDIPWPGGWRGVALVASGIALGFALGNWVGQAYQAHAQPGQRHAPMLLFPMVITIVTSAGMSVVFYLVGKSRYLQVQAEQAQRQAAEAQLKLLQTQLEPHMLFNTLANLQVLVASDPERAQAMLRHLIAYLRATLGGSRSQMHSLREEFERLDDYLALMAIRMGERLRYTLELPEALAATPVPTLLLQPLVENCIRHGLEPQLAGGSIAVAARMLQEGQGVRLELCVRDTGRGLSEHPAAAAPAAASGFGTAQVRERLLNCYGEAARLELSSADGGGTLARILIPLHTNHQEI
ncbi:histidine kinase [Comamonas sp. w2-DMI]|uniref:sensor histidine kinase n=1 Tax=Comamonas sp. w2-DMI TaxID=3126391 RepID=UPI0032E3F32B